MNISKLAIGLSAMMLVSYCGCRKEKKETTSMEFDFSKGKEGWQIFFSEYPVNNENFYQLLFDETDLPLPLTPKRSLRVSGNNHSDDLLSFMYRKVDHLRPNTSYLVTFSVDLASNVLANSPGAGGSPDLMLGAGGLPFAPSNSIDAQNIYRPNFESSIQSGNSNSVMDAIGKIGVSSTNSGYMPISRNNIGSPITLRTNNEGELWLMVGTDSGFEGITTLYYTAVKVTFERQ